MQTQIFSTPPIRFSFIHNNIAYPNYTSDAIRVFIQLILTILKNMQMKKQFTHLMITLTGALGIFSDSTIKAQTLTLTPSTYNGYNVSCFGAQNGSIDLTITGGTPPYTIRWSTDEMTEDISNLPAGYYRVEVDDADAQTDVVIADITLTQPEPLQIGELTPYVYQNGYNVSQFGSCNGSVTVNVSGGVTPYTYLWEPGQQTSGSPTNLCANENQVRINDANGCETSSGIGLSEPERDDWTMGGNWNSNPTTQFIGTLDNKDLSFRTYNQERLRIKSNGDLKINSLNGTDYQILMADANGVIKRIDKQIAPNVIPWVTVGNSSTNPATNFIGTTDNADFVFRTNNIEKARITTDGKFLLGTDIPGDMKFTIAHDDLNGGMSINRLASGVGKSEIRFEQMGDELWAIGNDLNNSGDQTFFIWDHLANNGAGATRFIINQFGKIGIGVTPPANNNSPYLLYVEGGIKTRDIKVTAINWPDYVFETYYNQMSLYELEQFIIVNKHLPNIPSAKEIESNGGYDVGDMVKRLVKTVEEQALFIIEQQKQIDGLKEETRKLERRK
jgi:hypothetical protein